MSTTDRSPSAGQVPQLMDQEAEQVLNALVPLLVRAAQLPNGDGLVLAAYLLTFGLDSAARVVSSFRSS